MSESQSEIKAPDAKDHAAHAAEIRTEMRAVRPKDIIEAVLKQSAKDIVDELER